MNDTSTTTLPVNITFSFDDTQLSYLIAGITLAIFLGVFFGVFINKKI